MNLSYAPYEIYTDGSAKSDGKDFTHGSGGWAYVIVRDFKVLYEGTGSQIETTNQRMELTAAIEALEYIEKNRRQVGEKVVVYSDSAYLINCYTKEWYKTWIRNGWVNAKKEPVANKDLWARLIPFFNMTCYTFEKVKGHADNYYNNICDENAQKAADECKAAYEKEKREAYYEQHK